MQIIHDLTHFQAPWDQASITLGVFDGMHRGHRALMKTLQRRSHGKNRARVLVTYNPHPDLVLGKRSEGPIGELFTYEEKLSLLQSYDLDAAVFLPFTRQIAGMTALRYLKEILVGTLKARDIIIGYDQTFGKGREGDYDFLMRMHDKFGYNVDRIEAVRYRDSVISSSLIRKSLREGHLEYANHLLGYDFFASGTVVRGNRRGSVMGFPTVNLEVGETKILPAEGVYTGYVPIQGKVHRAMINIGNNPTFNQSFLTLEAHILDFDANLYGETLRIYFHSRIRDEIRFESVEELVEQLRRDRDVARKIPVDKKSLFP